MTRAVRRPGPTPAPANDTRSALVYSTDAGRVCPGCRQPVAACRCAAARPVPAADGTVRIALDTKGRRGKAVTVVSGVPLDDAALAAWAKALRAACGCGGTVTGGTVELQGDHAARAAEAVQRAGWKVRRIGG